MRFASRPIFILQSLSLLWTEQGGDDEEWCETKYLIMWQANWKIEMSERHLDGSIQAPRCTSLNNNANPLLRSKLEGVITCRLGWQPSSRRVFTTPTCPLLTAMFVATDQLHFVPKLPLQRAHRESHMMNCVAPIFILDNQKKLASAFSLTQL